MPAFNFVKDNLYHTNGTFEYNNKTFSITFKEETLNAEWSSVTALSLEYHLYSQCRFFIELEDRVLIKDKNMRCLYFYFERKDFLELENFLMENGLHKLPVPNNYMMQYPFVKIYSMNMRKILGALTTAMNILLFFVLFARLYTFIDKKTGGLTKLQEIMYSISDFFSENTPVTSLLFSIPFLPFRIIYYYIKIVVNSLDEVSMGLFYLTSVLFYVFTAWNQMTSIIKMFLNIILFGKRLINKIRSTIQKKRAHKKRLIKDKEIEGIKKFLFFDNFKKTS
ncbi:Uncharacterized protein QTN25_006514 [Entamoeba marina]